MYNINTEWTFYELNDVKGIAHKVSNTFGQDNFRKIVT